MSNPPDPHPPQSVVVQPGDTVTTEPPKNPLTSVALWGLIITLLGNSLKRFGWRTGDPDLTNDTAVAIATIMGYAIGPGMIIWGRWKATRPLGFQSTKTSEVK